MKNLTKIIGAAVLPMLLLLSSCSMEKRIHRKGFHVSSSIVKTNKRMMKAETLADKKEISRVEEVDDSSAFTETNEDVNVTAISSMDHLSSVARPTNKEGASIIKPFLQNSALKNEVATQKQRLNQRIHAPRNPIKKKRAEHVKMNPQRKTAIITGASLLLMAVLAGIAMPVLGTLTASVGLIGIFILDLIVSFGVVKYHKKQKPKLAKTSGLLRILYTAFLGVAVGYHIAGSVAMFNKLWGIGLIFFGIHLITLGLLYDNEGGRKWLKYLIQSLLIIAGIGYIISYVGILLVPNPVGFLALMESIFIVPMILGEVFYALWMLIKGGKIQNSSQPK
jgi:hypothetical protein